MKTSITFKYEELFDLYNALTVAIGYYSDKFKETERVCGQNLNPDTYGAYREYQVKYEETKKMKARVLAVMYQCCITLKIKK